MKKKLALALAASFVLTTGSAFAAEIPNPLDLKFDGSLTIQYRNDEVSKLTGADAIKNGTHNGLKEIFVLNTTKKLTDNLDFYARFTYENMDKGLGNATYGSPFDYAKSEYNGTIDSFGVKIKSGNWNWVVGSQPLTIGAQGMVYDNGFIGKHALPYAINGSGKMGVVDTAVYYARTNYQEGLGDQDKFYGTNLSYDINDSSKVGVFYAHWVPGADSGIDSTNAYGVDYSHQFDKKLGFAAEYAKTDVDTDNTAYIAGLTYAVDNKNKVSAKYYRSEDFSNISDKNFGGMTTAPNANTKGYILSWNHTISADTSFGVSYDSYEHIKAAALTGTSNDRNRTKVSYNVNF